MKCISGNYCTETCFQSCTRWTSLGSEREIESHSVYLLGNRLLHGPGSCYLTRQPALLDFQNKRVGERKWEAKSYSHRHIYLAIGNWHSDPLVFTPPPFPDTVHCPLCLIQLLLCSMTALCFSDGVLLSRLVTTIFNICYIFLFLHISFLVSFSLDFSLFKFCLWHFYTLTLVLIWNFSHVFFFLKLLCFQVLLLSF